ncbi:thiomuracin/GE37468 family thiazolyl RiPP peptide [[Actinomadura] parvosata]|uniref:thiomuracin/GE37468 family thiazolyl RiPP peptide n=1 Tax=[Actinomadura] parvosata TaxID=1955412 RepID=UPI00406CE8BF
MSVSKKLDLSLDGLPLDAFDLADTDLSAESLTAGHGVMDQAASCTGCCSCSTSATSCWASFWASCK